MFDDALIGVKDIYLNSTNYFNSTDGLYVSGGFYGDGGGVYNIGASSLSAQSVGGFEIMDESIQGSHIMAGAVSCDHLMDLAIAKRHLTTDFQLSLVYLMEQIFSDSYFKVNELQAEDLAADFELRKFHFENRSIASNNIEAQEIDGDTIADNTLIGEDYKDGFIIDDTILADGAITSAHIVDASIEYDNVKPNSFGFDHLDSLVPIS